MQIESYQFGKIVIDGVEYCRDVIIAGGAVRPNWRRKQGHYLHAADLKSVIDAKPAFLIVGSGASGLMEVADDTWQVLKENNIEPEVLDTYKAVAQFNRLCVAGKNVAAALHLTC
jgi:hypothetical protein